MRLIVIPFFSICDECVFSRGLVLEDWLAGWVVGPELSWRVGFGQLPDSLGISENGASSGWLSFLVSSLVLLSFWLYLFLLCLSRQTSHLIWSWIAGFRQSQQSPRDFASARLAWVLRRCSSRRSGVWGLFRSYFRPFSALALTFLGFVLGWRSVCCAFGVAFSLGFLTVGFRRGSCTGGCLSLRGPLPVFCGLGNGKVYSKVRPIARGRRVQWSCPAGGGLQARAIRWASPRSSSFRRRLAWGRSFRTPANNTSHQAG